MDARVDIQLQQFLKQLLSLQGMLAVLLLVLALIVVTVFARSKWMLLPLLLYISNLGRTFHETEEHFLVFPLEQMRTQSRVLCVALMVLLLVASIRSSPGWRHRTVLAGAAMYFVFQLVFSATLVGGGDVSRGILGAVTHVLTFLTLAWGVSRWLQDVPDAIAIVRCVVVAAALFCLGTIWQLAINKTAAIQQDRLMATAGNPQAAATIIACCLLNCLFLLVRAGEPRAWRILGGATAGLLVGMLLWTGSRTGALMSLVGLIMLFRFRAGKLLLGVMVAGAFTLLLMHLFAESGSNLDRFSDTTDTRTHVWRSQLQTFLASPLTGGRLREAFGSENSYLDVAARTGLVGLLPLLVSMGLVAVAVVRMNRLKAALGRDSMLVDLITAGIASLAVGAFFEGYLVGIYSFMVFLLYIYAALMAFVIDYATAPVPDDAAAPGDARAAGHHSGAYPAAADVYGADPRAPVGAWAAGNGHA